MPKKLTIREVQETFILFCEADRLFSSYGYCSGYGEMELLEHCANYILHKNVNKFIEDTSMSFDFNRSRVNTILKKFKETKKSLLSIYYGK